jgi:hypothetical protein
LKGDRAELLAHQRVDVGRRAVRPSRHGTQHGDALRGDLHAMPAQKSGFVGGRHRLAAA